VKVFEYLASRPFFLLIPEQLNNRTTETITVGLLTGADDGRSSARTSTKRVLAVEERDDEEVGPSNASEYLRGRFFVFLEL
jgi:hypothetical protein